MSLEMFPTLWDKIDTLVADGRLISSEEVLQELERKEGDTLHNLAARFYPALSNGVWSAAHLFWVVADFQPQPIHDATIRLVPGQRIVAPSERVVREQIFTGNFDS